MSDRALRLGVAALALAGAGISLYLALARLLDSSVACPTSGCDIVARSSYSELAGVPVAWLGVAGYAVILASATLRGPLPAAVGAAAAVAGAAFAAYLLVVQLVVIDAVCVWCVASDAVLAALVPLTVLRAWRLSGG